MKRSDWNGVAGVLCLSLVATCVLAATTASNNDTSTQSAAASTTTDYCVGSTCKNGAVCESGAGNYTCNCTSGWTGWQCDIDADDCNPNPCKNRGNCSDLGTNNYTCSCAVGWTGDNCETVEYCHNATCNNGATCKSGADNYTCTCSPGWAGWQCDADIDDCESTPCKNDGNCTDAGINNFTCSCAEGWMGKTCEIDVDNQCETNPCGQFGFCQNSKNNYTCYCNDGKDGHSCSKPDICATKPCKVNEECENNNVSYTCRCKEGYKIKDNGCEEILLFSYQSQVSGENEMYGPYFAGGGLPYFGQTYTALYVNRNGYIILDRHRNLKNPILNGSDWPADIKLIAPLWSHWDVPSEGADLHISKYYSYRDNDRITVSEIQEFFKKKDPGFKVEFAFLATWMDVIPHPASQYKGFQNVTFQCTIATDGVKSYAVFAYDEVHIADDIGIEKSSGYSTANSAVTLQTVTSGTRKPDVYELFNNSVALKPNDNYKCLDTVARLPAPAREGFPNNYCPCTISQAQLDMRFDFQDTTACAVDRLGSAPAKCCYDKTSGTLLTSDKSSGYPQNSNETISQQLSTAHDLCCGVNSTVCGVFYAKFPSDTCADYKRLKMVQIWGNPVSSPDDGPLYIFNGLGEYYLAGNSKTDVWLKGRFGRLQASMNITVLQAVTIQVNLQEVVAKLSNNMIEFSYENKTIQNGNKTTYFSLINNTVIFTNGIYMEVRSSEGLLVSLYVPESSTDADFINHGLISVFDAESFNQSLVEAAKIPENTTSDLAGFPLYFSNYSTFRDILFQSNASQIADANTTCGSDISCLVAYPKGAVAGKLITDRQQTERNLKSLNVKPPVFSKAPAVWNFTLSDGTYTNTILAENTNITISTNENKTLYSFNDTTGQFTWNLTSALLSSEKYFKFIAQDSLGDKAMYSPVIVMCSCSDTSQCDYSVVNYVQPRTLGLFFRAQCHCPDNKMGERCETPRNICDQCFPTAICNATNTDSPCTCPDYLEGDGIMCYDKNECLDDVCGDNAYCENHIGYKNCSCFKGYEDKNGMCVDINECKSKKNRCQGYVDELRQFCVNTPGSCSVSCRPTFRGTNCTQKVNYVYGGQIVFAEVPGRHQIWNDGLRQTNSDTFKQLADKVIAVVTSVLNNKFKSNTFIVRVTEFNLITPSGTRRRRAADDTVKEISASYNVATDDQISAPQLMEALTDGYTCDPQNSSCNLGSGSNTLVGVSRALTTLNDDLDLCASESTNDCHKASTTCTSGSGTFSCQCKPGFKEWPLQENTCEDIDECSNGTVVQVCGAKAITCSNTAGSFTCGCQSGYSWSGSECQLTDHCSSGPCEYGGSCVNTPGEEPGYACKCTYGRTGATCSDKDTEAERQRVIIIAVSASLGGLCFILLVALCCVCGRKKQSSKSRRHEDYILDNNGDSSVMRLPRPQIRRNTDNVEMVENLGSKTNLYMPLEEEMAWKERQDSFNKHTKFERHPEGYTNAAYNGSTSGTTHDYEHL